MLRKRLVLAILALVIILSAAQVQAARTPTSTTIPPVPAVSAGVFYGCQPFEALPGSVTPGTNGFILISCGPEGGALSLDGTLTPSLTLGLGYTQAGIVENSGTGNTFPCNLNFVIQKVGNVTVPSGHLLNSTLTFSSNPAQGQMLTAAYDYCLQYANAPSTGLAGFSIVWT